MEQALKVKWIDHKREPRCAPNPDYPDGIDLPSPEPDKPFCKATLPYPAKRCGVFVVECPICGARVAATTAGRPDDPRSIEVPCKLASETRQ